MAKLDRAVHHKTNHEGVTFICGTSHDGREEKIFYIRYYKDGKRYFEKAGRQYSDSMTSAKASRIRARKIEGDEKPNTIRRQDEKELKEAEANRWTINKLWEDYNHFRPSVKSKQVDLNRYINHLQSLFGDKEPQDITLWDVQKLRKKLEQKLKPQTVKHVLSLLQRIVNHGLKYHQTAPLNFKMTIPKVDNLKTEDVTQEQFQKLWQAIEEETDVQGKNFVKMVLFTGMRRGELFKLRWQDIDFEKGFIWIERPKGGKSQNIPINDSARQLLLSHERPYPQSPYVFPGRDGEQRKEIKRIVNRIVHERAGLPAGFRALHGLRHVYASMMISSGQIEMYQLQKLLTHKDPRMTQRYAHLRDEALRRAANANEEIIEQALRKKIDLKHGTDQQS
ncbi:MAG: tyrosine-type recombinase/integrase [SAR324 cluster bacterium]|nr:tyrosine-type recombinase/integrase [SAR324 cluster bacterium]